MLLINSSSITLLISLVFPPIILIMFRTESLMFAASTDSLFVLLSLLNCSQTSGAISECSSSCGNIQIKSPFRLQRDHQFCGNKSYELSCEADGTGQSHHPVLYLFSGIYYVQAVNYNNYTIRLVDAGVRKTTSNYSNPVYPLTEFNFTAYPYSTHNPYWSYSSSYTYFESDLDADNPFNTKYLTAPLIFLSCTNQMNDSDVFVKTARCSSGSSRSTVYSYFMLGYWSTAEVGLSCKIKLMVMVSFPRTLTDEDQSCQGIYEQLGYGFELSWIDYQCRDTCGQNYANLEENPNLYCGLTTYKNKTGVECRSTSTTYEGGEHGARLTKKKKHGAPAIKILGSCALSVILLVTGATIYYIYSSVTREQENQLKIKRFLDEYRALKPSRYSYADIKRMTDQFKEKLGQGAYGTVFKGRLSSELLVAVKILDNSNEKGEDFVNEVRTMGQIYHVNVVRLVGYCADGSVRALVYEFLPNGPLQNFLSSADNENSFLGWDKLQDIALGIAKGIEYLHQGCEQQILHFDIKPHNVLLDHNFTPKVSDFGLAKLCSKDQSAVSMTAARGTMGYIAPEVFSRNFGNVSYKADVYSFGTLLLEMVGGRKNFKVIEDSSSQVYFPEWIYNLLEQGNDLRIHIGDEGNVDIARKLAIVGLWCIQWHPIDRPSMKTVVQMLEREGDNLTMPPNPFASTSSSS